MGILKQAQQGSGPAAATPPGGGALSGGLAASAPAGSGPSEPMPDFETLRSEAIRAVYDEQFETLIEMFQTNGPERFARSVAVTVNKAISDLEAMYGAIPHEDAAKIGVALILRLIEDMATGDNPPVQGVSPDQMSEIVPATLMLYQESHPEVTLEEIQAVLESAMQQIQGGEGVPGDEFICMPEDQAEPAAQPPMGAPE